jgi:3-hydroxyacyl-CoA dehydrogenase
MLIRNMDTLYEDSVPDTFPFVRRAFETIGMAKVSFSIKEAMEIGYLRRTDRIVMNRDHLLHEAKKMAKGMLVGGFVPSCPRNDLHLPGENGYAAIKAGLYAMKLGGYISEHDETIGTKLAYVLTGGKISPKEPVSEQNILDLECEAFLSLCGYEKTIARMQHMLLKNKPLRN